MQKKTRTADFVLVGMFAALMAIGANITSIVPFLQVGGIPLTMQPFFCVLAGLLLGRRLGALAMIVYALVGIAGAPVFAQFSAGFGVILGKSGGFVLSYIPAAWLAGFILEKRKNPGFGRFLLAAIAGTTVMYVIGTTYTYLALNVWLNAPISYQTTWFFMIWFMVKDYALTILLAMLAPKIYRSVSKATSFRKQEAVS
ncbi:MULTISPECIES: biotin transporter BioY [Bacillus]|jgi:biotin transport system substrate-specific component|uniref:biotin transporter BioY n=1 Tax=Bacillus TaxID=1386 RepID=UPI000407A437|nr:MULTISPECIES: biotin transporter BioY [Bacillus]KLK99236.1 biotin biosynthesis protein BioC [Bacillus pumilus]AIZ61401.1 biotin biosynthesis protein BioC [Bacillus sp. WP8]ARD57375.1 BioY family transporter [Bacillus safensis]AWI38039.1 biotin biosynthesis protein BioC [Bacillus safensis FO-36b]KDE26964.1 biotin synthase [Bacillus safensis FO-36b]